jgi:urease accessory protein
LQAQTPVELADGTACLMLLNPTGGLVGGDFLLSQIILEAGTQVCLTTPSATRVYRTLDPPAVQETHIQAGEGASLEYVPDHVIPHRDSKFRQSLRVEMDCGSRAIFWDALAAGRVARGERWQFHEVDSRIEVTLRGKPVYLNRTRINPASLDPNRLGFAQDFSYMGTLLVVSDATTRWNEVTAALNAELENTPQVFAGVNAGVSALAANGCVVKLLARSASDLMRAQTALWGRARQAVFGSPAMDLRKY